MFEATIKETAPETVAFLPMHGSYDQIPDGFRQLYEWVEHYGLQPTGAPEAVYLTMPQTTKTEALYELWAPVAPGLSETPAAEDRIGVKLIGEETVASTVHRGPYETVGGTYEELGRWISENGYAPVGPPREIYMSPPDTPPQDIITEIQFPVQRSA